VELRVIIDRMVRMMIVVLAAAGCGRGGGLMVGSDGSPVGSRSAVGGGAPVDASGDRHSVITEYESQGCSSDRADEPLFVCSIGDDLACISTYGVQVTNPAERQRWDGGVRSVYVCRLLCQPSGPACLQIGDVCCPGVLAGGGMENACVPRTMCEAVRDAAAD
jgi:hypothetical protein